MTDDGLAFFRGLFISLALCLPFWATVAVIWWAV